MVRGQAEGDDVTRSSPNVGVGLKAQSGAGKRAKAGRTKAQGVRARGCERKGRAGKGGGKKENGGR